MPKQLWLVALAFAAAACQRTPDQKSAPPTGSAAPTEPSGPKQPPPVARPTATPPLPVAQPPADAEPIKGIAPAPDAVVYVKRLQAGTGEQPGRNDTVEVNMNGWRTNGDTFLTTKSRNRPVQQNLAMLAPGFAAGVMSMKVGERAMIWVPPQLGYMGAPQSAPETTVYEVELVSLERSPATPPDVAAPPASAVRSKTGLASLVVKPGTGTTPARYFDGVVFHYSAWDSTGRMFDSSEVRKRPKSTFGFHEWPGLEEALTSMVVGERRRVWIPHDLADPSLPGLPPGTLCFELELLEVNPMAPPPPVPSDLAAPPADASRTAHGVAMKVLTPGTGTVHPTLSDVVSVQFSGWRTDGRLFDSSIVRGEPGEFILGKLMPGWIEALQLMVPGEKVRLWVPQDQAFRGEPGRPAGTLVFELELLDVKAGPQPRAKEAVKDAAAGGGAAPAAPVHGPK